MLDSSTITTQAVINSFPLDTSSYRLLTSPLNFQVILISTLTLKIAQVAMLINSGSVNDPDRFPGLAHFLEHMVFINNEKYPEIDAFMKIVGLSGGYTNAYTADDRTVFYYTFPTKKKDNTISNNNIEHNTIDLFKTNNFSNFKKRNFLLSDSKFTTRDTFNEDSLFVKTLDMFSQFFKNPVVFEEKYVNREINAVHSEYINSLENDGHRYFDMFKREMKETCPYRRFSVGNLETLQKDNLLEALTEMHDEKYIPSNMKLVINSNMSLDELETIVLDKFDHVFKFKETKKKDSKTKQIDYNESIWKSKTLNSTKYTNVLDSSSQELVEFSLNSGKNEMVLAWSIGKYQNQKNSQALKVISRWFNSEKVNSLSNHLSRQGLVSSLGSSLLDTNKDFSMFGVYLSLTQKGLDNIGKIIYSIFTWVSELLSLYDRKKIIQYYKEAQKINELQFYLHQPRNDVNKVMNIANNLNDFEAERAVVGDFKMEVVDPLQLKFYLTQLLSQDRLRIFVASNSFTELSKNTGKHYNIDYNTFNCPITRNDKEFSGILKVTDDFLTSPIVFPTKEEEEQFIVKKGEINEPVDPVKIDKDTYITTTSKFLLPRVFINLSFTSYNFNSSLKQFLYSKVFVRLLDQYLAPMLSEYNEIGCYHYLVITGSGLQVYLSCLTNNMDNFVSIFIQGLKTFEFQKIHERIMVFVINDVKADLIAMSKKPLFRQVGEQFKLLIGHYKYTHADQLALLERLGNLDSKEFREFLVGQRILEKGLFGDANMVFYGHGRWDDWRLLKINEEIRALRESKITYVPERSDMFSVEEIVGTEVGQVSGENANNVLVVLIDLIRLSSVVDRINTYFYMIVMGNLLENAFFTELRTEKQLGYAVNLGVHTLDNTISLIYLVQSPTASREEIKKDILEFKSNTARRIIDELSIQTLETVIESLIESIGTPMEKMEDEVMLNWGRILSGTVGVDRNNLIIDILNKICVDDIKTFYNKYIDRERRSIDTGLSDYEEIWMDM